MNPVRQGMGWIMTLKPCLQTTSRHLLSGIIPFPAVQNDMDTFTQVFVVN